MCKQRVETKVWSPTEPWIRTDTGEGTGEVCYKEPELAVEETVGNRRILDLSEINGLGWWVGWSEGGVLMGEGSPVDEAELGTRFSTDFTSSNDFLGRVGFFFFDRRTMITMTMIITITPPREMRMIVVVDKAFTINDSWVLTDPTSLEALMVRRVEDRVVKGIPEITPVEELRYRPEGRIPEVILKKGWSPVIEGEIENECPLMRVKESWG